MKKKTNTTKKEQIVLHQQEVVIAQTNQDFRNAVLLVSVAVNVFILTAWVALQVTTAFDAEVAQFLFAR